MPRTSCDCCLIPCICTAEIVSSPKNTKFQALFASKVKQCEFCTLIPCICVGTSVLSDPRPTSPEPAVEPIHSIEEITDIETLELPEYLRINQVPSTPALSNAPTCIQMDIPNANTIPVPEMIFNKLKPHQKQGIQFLSQALCHKKGAILADYMGLGKTLQVLTTLYGYIAGTNPSACILIVCPTICIQNWTQEYRKWLSHPTWQENCPLYTFEGKETLDLRLDQLSKWHTNGGLLVLGYEMYRLLLSSRSVSTKTSPYASMYSRVSSDTIDYGNLRQEQQQARHEDQMKQLQNYLVSPGPDVIVLDEGHRIKDPQSQLCQQLQQIATKARVLVTGYPIQNRLAEYWCMVNFVRPGFLGSYDTFRDTFELPIWNCQTGKSGKPEDEATKELARLTSELSIKLKPMVLRRSSSLLEAHLPPKAEWIIRTKLSPFQLQLYNSYLNTRTEQNEARGLLAAYSTLLHVINHPDILYKQLQDSQKKKQRQLPGIENQKWVAPTPSNSTTPKDAAKESASWARPVFEAAPAYNPHEVAQSGKLMVLMQLIQHTLACKDKILIFSQSVATLSTLTSIFKALNGATEVVDDASKSRKRRRDPANTHRRKIGRKKPRDTKTTRSERYAYLQIDGTTSTAKRMEYIRAFNDPQGTIPIMLISTRAGAEGINLHAANRVVLFDVSWNPSFDHQAMCRSHRFGQVKPVHVYRLVAADTIENQIYDLQVKKIGLADRIVDEHTFATIYETRKTSAVPFLSTVSATPSPGTFAKELPQDPVLAQTLAARAEWILDYNQIQTQGKD